MIGGCYLPSDPKVTVRSLSSQYYSRLRYKSASLALVRGSHLEAGDGCLCDVIRTSADIAQ